MDYTNDDAVLDPLVDEALVDDAVLADPEAIVEESEIGADTVYDVNADGEIEEAA